MALYQTQPDRKFRAKALAKEYGIGGHSHDFLDGSRGFVNHDWKGLEFDHYPDHQKITLKWAQVEKYIDLMIQSDRYLTDEEKEQRTARQEAERQLPMLDGTVAAEYTALKEQYPNTLVGFELNGNYLFYDKDAVAVERILRTNLLSQENALGRVKVTGFPTGQWAADAKKLWAEGNSIYLAGQSENGTHHRTKYLREEDYLPIGSIIKLDGRDFRVDHVNFMFKSVSLQDMDLTNSGQPIFRSESLPHIRELYEQQQDEIVDVSPEKTVDYKVGDEVVVDLPTRTIEGKIGYVGETDVRMGAVSELLKQLDYLHSYDLLNQYAMKSLTIAPDNPKAYGWLIRSLKAQGMNELATNELAAAKEHLTTEEYEEILAFGANW